MSNATSVAQMAPNSVLDSSIMKRSTSQAELDAPGPKKLRRSYQRHHRLAWLQQIEGHPSIVAQDEEDLQKHAVRALSLVLEAIGFEQADPYAMESLRLMTEEYMRHFLDDVRQAMLSARRIQPVPQDFLHALNTHNLQLSSLIPHLDPPVHPKKCLPLLVIETPRVTFDDSAFKDPAQEQQINKLLKETHLSDRRHIPSSFPPLPSRHTYKAEPMFNERELDTKKVRERATEEGRLGEEALRKLMSTRFSRMDDKVTAKTEANDLSFKQRSRVKWKNTMQAMLNEGSNARQTTEETADLDMIHGASIGTKLDFQDYSATVNADSGYWRKPVGLKQSQTAAVE